MNGVFHFCTICSKLSARSSTPIIDSFSLVTQVTGDKTHPLRYLHYHVTKTTGMVTSIEHVTLPEKETPGDDGFCVEFCLKPSLSCLVDILLDVSTKLSTILFNIAWKRNPRLSKIKNQQFSKAKKACYTVFFKTNFACTKWCISKRRYVGRLLIDLMYFTDVNKIPEIL